MLKQYLEILSALNPVLSIILFFVESNQLLYFRFMFL